MREYYSVFILENGIPKCISQLFDSENEALEWIKEKIEEGILTYGKKYLILKTYY